MPRPPVFRSATMPVSLGSPLRAPSYAWKAWGVEWNTEEDYWGLVALSEAAYKQEWEMTGSAGHDDISTAAENAGLGNANQRLNEAVARIVAVEAAARGHPLRLLDIGAGSGDTTLSILKAIKDRDGLFYTLVDPAERALGEARSRLRKTGLSSGRHFELHCASDIETTTVLDSGSFDIIVAVASLHHHSDIHEPIGALSGLLAPGGLLVVGDWHNTVWEHPSRVLELLKRLHWAGKADDLDDFVDLYPNALEVTQKVSGRMLRANKLVGEFWKAYSSCRTASQPQFLLLEGHRPPQRYIEAMGQHGLVVSSGETGSIARNPMFLSPEESLLAITAGRKPLG